MIRLFNNYNIFLLLQNPLKTQKEVCLPTSGWNGNKGELKCKHLLPSAPHLTPLNFFPGTTFFDIAPSYQLLTSTNMHLYMTCKLINATTGLKLDPAVVVAPTNALLYTAFSSANLKIGNTTASNIDQHYGLQNYLQLLLSYNPMSKRTWLLENALFSMDTPGHFEDMTKDGANKGFNERYIVF